MMRLLYLLICISFSFIDIIRAQGLSINGIILDENAIIFPGVQIDLHSGKSAIKQSERADQNGKFTFNNLPIGEYFLYIQFLGYENDSIHISLIDANIELKPIQLKIASKSLSEIVIKEKKPIGAILNDTLQFNASSFKVMKDATADELIGKMPSVTNDQGTLKAHGDEVKQVLIDGKPFFGTDPNLSLKNLPAELIDKVQIFDQLSEQSQFTGINDGNTVKTINIVTKSGLNNGQFGKLYAGFGTTNKYQLGGNFNYFDGNRRLSIIGMSNNINVQNFAIDDILGVIGAGNQRNRNNFGGPPRTGNDPRRDNRNNSGGPGDFLVPQSGGINTTHAIGINYGDKLSSKLDLTISYFYNQTKNNIVSELTRQYFKTDGISQRYFENSNSAPININHRINGRLEYKIDSFNSIIFRPKITFQSNSSSGNSENGTSFISDTIFNTVAANSSKNNSQFNTDGFNVSNNLLVRHKFNKTGRTISLDLTANYAPKNETIQQSSLSQYAVINAQNTFDTIQIHQRQNNAYKKWGFNTNVEYTEPINSLNSLSINYRYNIGQDRTELNTFDLGTENMAIDTLNTGLSNSFKSNSESHQIGLGYQFNKEQKLNMSIRTSWQYAKIDNQQYFPTSYSQQTYYYNILPSLFMRYSFSRTKNLNIQYRVNTQLPTITQLQNVLNNSNPVQLSIGNPNLKQAVNQNMNIRFSSTNENATMIYFMVGGTYTSDYIANHLYIKSRKNPVFLLYNIANGVQLSLPENTKSSLQLRSFFSYTIPIPKIKCNLSIDASYIYSETPGLLDTSQFTTYQQNSTLGLALTSNISQNIDFNIQFRPSYNTYKSSDTKSNYFIFDQRVKFNWQFTGKNVIRIEFNSKINQDLSQQFNQNVYLLNLALGRKVFSNERGEVAIGVNDIFNQNKSIQRNVSEYYIEDSKSNILQRFLMFSFTYNIRNYNSGKKPPINKLPDPERIKRWRD